jgi:hypothetical protein
MDNIFTKIDDHFYILKRNVFLNKNNRNNGKRKKQEAEVKQEEERGQFCLFILQGSYDF